jgi:hypothetical protein
VSTSQGSRLGSCGTVGEELEASGLDGVGITVRADEGSDFGLFSGIGGTTKGTSNAFSETWGVVIGFNIGSGDPVFVAGVVGPEAGVVDATASSVVAVDGVRVLAFVPRISCIPSAPKTSAPATPIAALRLVGVKRLPRASDTHFASGAGTAGTVATGRLGGSTAFGGSIRIEGDGFGKSTTTRGAGAGMGVAGDGMMRDSGTDIGGRSGRS